MEKETLPGKLFTAVAIGVGIYIGIKNYKSSGFWNGALALFLLGVSVRTYKKQAE